MQINNPIASDFPKKIERPVSEKIQQEEIKRNASAHVERWSVSDQVELSEEARALQRSTELKVRKELLDNLPSSRAHIIYGALAKWKAGVYLDEKIISEAANKLLESGELNDILAP